MKEAEHLGTGDEIGHLTADDLEKYFRQPLPAVRRLSAQPPTYLLIDPATEQIRLRVPPEPGFPDVMAFDRITFEVVRELGEDDEWFELAIDATDNHHEAYLVMAAIVDLVVSGTPFTDAVTEGLRSFQELLLRKRRLTDEQQIGLFGELLLLEHAITHVPAPDVVGAWTGTDQEEHDFLFEALNVEVKTTRSEKRIHVITSASQLQPSPERPLYLLSVQVTAAGAAAQGRGLGDVIGNIREDLPEPSRHLFDKKLEEIGWRDDDAELYQRRWVLRSAPRAFLIDDDFPALTPSRIAAIVPQASHVIGVQYRLDLTQLEADATIPELLEEFCKEPQP